jgi:hypothetical protein
MKTLKFVSYTALVILLIQIGLTISIPFRFPNDIFAWDIVISTDLLLAILCVLLLTLLKLKKNNRPKVIFGAALVALIFINMGLTPWIIPAVFLVALLGIYLAFSRI